MNTLTMLSHSYASWCKDNNLPIMSADELLCENGLTEKQKEYLKAFINLWQMVEGGLV